MRTRCFCATIAIALGAYLPLIAADDAFQMEAIPLPGPSAADTSLPPVQMVSVTLAAASSVTVNPCIGGTRGCPDPTSGYASIPFPSAALPVGGDVVVTWMFQDLSYNGPTNSRWGSCRTAWLSGNRRAPTRIRVLQPAALTWSTSRRSFRLRRRPGQLQ